jgi:hypothetical protein
MAEEKLTGLFYVCECGNKIPIGSKNSYEEYCWNASFDEYDRYIGTEKVCSISGVCPNCNKHFGASIDL